MGGHETFEMPCKFRPNEPPGPAFPAPQNDAGGGVYGGSGGDGGDGGGIATWRMTLPPLHVASLLPATQHEYGWSGASAAEPHVLPTL